MHLNIRTGKVNTKIKFISQSRTGFRAGLYFITMKKTLTLSVSALILSACNVSTNPENNASLKLDSLVVKRETKAPEHYTGLFRAHQSNFLDCGSGQLFVLTGLPPSMDTMYSNILPDAYADEAVYVEMEAARDAQDPTALHYTSGLKMERKNYKNTCIASDYWVMGIEPFWQIQISKAEGLIDFHDPMAQKTTHFVYAAPEIKNGVEVYSTTDGENTIRISVKKEKCNGAVDKQYDYSAQVEFNGKKYSGCAIKPE